MHNHLITILERTDTDTDFNQQAFIWAEQTYPDNKSNRFGFIMIEI